MLLGGREEVREGRGVFEYSAIPAPSSALGPPSLHSFRDFPVGAGSSSSALRLRLGGTSSEEEVTNAGLDLWFGGATWEEELTNAGLDLWLGGAT